MGVFPEAPPLPMQKSNWDKTGAANQGNNNSGASGNANGFEHGWEPVNLYQLS